MAIDWHETQYGYDSRFYRIRRIERGAGWRLETAPLPGRVPPAPAHVSTHDRLAHALRRAERDERERLRALRIKGYVVVGAASSLVFLTAAAAMDGITPFLVMLVAGYVTLRAGAAALAVRLDDVWGWNRDDGRPRPTPRFDRVVEALATFVQRDPEWPAPRPTGAVTEVHPTSATWQNAGLRSRRSI